jgi:hypothetical protein
VFRIHTRGFDVKDKTESPEECVFEVVYSMRAFWNAPVEIRNKRRRDSEAQRETGLESIAFTDIADLGDICFYKPESVSLDCSTPLA